jgi:hypothetical protein
MARKNKRKNLVTDPQVELRGRVALSVRDRVTTIYDNTPKYRSWNACFTDLVLHGLAVMEGTPEIQREPQDEAEDVNIDVSKTQ